MCGIAGIWYRGGQAVEQMQLKRMADALQHRGPDGEGFWRRENIGFAHRRLNILDTSVRGSQPMSTPDGQLQLVFNGAIHNYRELRDELGKLGICFMSDTDTEVALWSYRVWGNACFEKFNGMWAMAIWDSARRELLLTRDRFGIKPLYYSQRAGRVAFASEAKAIIEVFGEERQIHRAELSAFLHGHPPDRSHNTFFENIFQVLPGHVMRISHDNTGTEKYWRFVPGSEIARPDIEEHFLALLTDSVRLRLRSDIPVGATLSGGLDSSAVAMLAAQVGNAPLQTFSLRYDDPKIDESRYAQMVLDENPGLLPHFFQPPPGEIRETIRKTTWHHDAPCPSRGRYAAWHLMKETSRHRRVILTGEGSDEILAGYNHFIVDAMLDRRRLDYASYKVVFSELGDLAKTTGHPARRLLKNKIRKRFFPSTFPVAGMLTDAANNSCRADRRDDYPKPYQSRLNNALWHEFNTRGLPEMLHHFDACTMAFGVEGRAPLLDHRIVELVFSLPFNEKIRDGWTKSLLRRAMKNILPETVRLRRHKLGYPAPLNSLFRDPAEAAAIRSELLDGEAVRQGWLDRKILQKELGARLAPGKSNNPEVLWRLLSVEYWLRDFIASE